MSSRLYRKVWFFALGRYVYTLADWLTVDLSAVVEAREKLGSQLQENKSVQKVRFLYTYSRIMAIADIP